MPPSHQTVRLAPGSHRTPDSGVCVMELASMLAGEPFGDHPRCTSSVVAALLRGYNDGLDDARRQTLKRFAAACVGTATGRDDERRRRALLREELPAVLGQTGWRARMKRRLGATYPYGVTHGIGRRVAAAGDDALHARVVALLDVLMAVGAPPTGAHATQLRARTIAIHPDPEGRSRA